MYVKMGCHRRFKQCQKVHMVASQPIRLVTTGRASRPVSNAFLKAVLGGKPKPCFLNVAITETFNDV